MEAHYCKIKITRDGKVVVTSKMLHFVKSQQKLPKFGFRSHTTALWPMEQSSILSAKFDCPVVNLVPRTSYGACSTKTKGSGKDRL